MAATRRPNAQRNAAKRVWKKGARAGLIAGGIAATAVGGVQEARLHRAAENTKAATHLTQQLVRQDVKRAEHWPIALQQRGMMGRLSPREIKKLDELMDTIGIGTRRKGVNPELQRIQIFLDYVRKLNARTPDEISNPRYAAAKKANPRNPGEEHGRLEWEEARERRGKYAGSDGQTRMYNRIRILRFFATPEGWKIYQNLKQFEASTGARPSEPSQGAQLRQDRNQFRGQQQQQRGQQPPTRIARR